LTSLQGRAASRKAHPEEVRALVHRLREQLLATGATVIALPMKIKRSSDGPLRIVAVVPK